MSPSLELRLVRPAFWTRSMLWLCALPTLVYVLFGPGWAALWDSAWSFSSWLPVVVLVAPTLVVTLVRRLTRPHRLAPIQTFDDHLTVPRSANPSKARSIPYSSLLGIEIMAKGKLPVLLIATTNGPTVLPLHQFADPNAAQRLRDELHTRLRTTPGGIAILRRMFDQSRVAQRVGAVKVHFTQGILLLLALVFLFEEWMGATQDPKLLLQFGANAAGLVAEGQYFRLLSANFLHGGIVHIGMNSLGLLALGSLLERLLGWPRLALIYCVSAFSGSLASMWFGQALLSVGASTAIFGLLGSLGYLSYRFRGQLPMGVQQPLRTWLFIGGMNTLLPIVIPQIDWLAHVGGGVGGALVTALLIRSPEILMRSVPASAALRALAVASCALSLGALGTALLRSPAEAERDWQQLQTHLLTQPSSPLEQVNLVAWGRAIDAEASQRELLEAREALSKSLANDENRSAVLSGLRKGAEDTLATLHYRLGDFATAVELERQVIEGATDPSASWQVARFAFAQFLASNAEPRTANPLIQSIVLSPGAPEHFTLTVPGPHPDGAEVWVALADGRRLLGALVVGVGPSATPTTVRHALPRLGLEKGAAQLSVVIADTSPCASPCPPRARSLRFVRPDPAARDYP